MSWTAIRNALHDRIALATGLPVIIADQNAKAPTTSYVAVRLSDITPLGAADELQLSYDSGASAGQEIIQTIVGQREFVLSLQCFVRPAVQDTDARALLSAFQTSLGLPSYQAAIESVGCSIFDLGTIRYVPAISGTEFEGRAVLEMRGYAAETTSESTGYLTTAYATNDSTSPPDTFPLD